MPFLFLSFIVLCPTTTQANVVRTPPLIQAVQSENMSLFMQLIKGVTDVNILDTLGRTAAHYAVLRNNLKALELLLNNGTDVNLSDNQGKTMLDLWQRHKDEDMFVLLQNAGAAGTAQDLWQAAANNVRVSAEHLLAAGADANAKNAEGKTPFRIAVEAEHAALAAILLRAAAGIDGEDEKSWTPLMWAIVADDWDLVREFLAEGADISAGSRQNALDIATSMKSEAKLLEAIVEEMGVDASAVTSTLKLKDMHGISTGEIISWTPLMWAIVGNDWDLVREFIGEGAYIGAVGYHQSAWHIATLMESENKLIEAVIAAKGVDVIIGENERTMLMHTAIKGETKKVKLLLEHGANIDGKDTNRWTALLYAAREGKTETVTLLLEHGANIEAKNFHGWTALMIAAREGKTEMVALLLKHGASIEAQDKKYGWTALMYAAMHGKTKTVKLLLEHGANIEAKNSAGKTALMIAEASGHKKIAQLLREYSEGSLTWQQE